MSHIFIIPLRQLHENHGALVGGKAASLGRLHELLAAEENAFVPTGFCWTSTASMELIGSIYRRFEERLRSFDLERDALFTLSEEMHACILSCEFPPFLQENLKEQCGTLMMEKGLAVRSSGIEEDGSTASFAGQHATHLGVSNHSALLDAIRDCIASGYTYSTMRYRQRHGFPLPGAPMPLVIQQLVQARSAGVLLTRDPRGKGDTAWLEAIWGLGELVVSGEVTPDSFSIMLESGKVKSCKVAQKRQRRVWYNNCIQDVAVEPPYSLWPSLTFAEVERIALLGKGLEHLFGYSLEVEWACCEDDRLALLQARPLTSMRESQNS